MKTLRKLFEANLKFNKIIVTTEIHNTKISELMLIRLKFLITYMALAHTTSNDTSGENIRILSYN